MSVHAVCAKSVSLAALCAVLSPLTARPQCASGPIQIANHTAEFKGVLYDNPAPGQSTWFYTITSGRKPAISHVTFAMMCADIRILGAGMWNGTDYGSRMYKAGMPEPGSFPGTPKGDPTTGVIGLKFDLGFDDNATRHYYFTVNGYYEAAPMQVALKAGNGFASGYLCGPSQECAGPQLSSVGDFVWLDANDDGIQDSGENGVQGVTVYLLSADGDILEQTATDANGYYLFDDLVDGNYRVRFVLPAGHLFTASEAGEDYEADSDADPLTGDSGVFYLPQGTDIRYIDAGLVQSAASIKLTKTGEFHPGTTDPWAFCTVFGPAHVFNALIFGDFTAAGGDTDGRLAVGGNAVITNGYSVGISLHGHPLPTYFGGATDMFIVGGDLNDFKWGVNGNIVYGGERTGPARWMVDGNLLRKVSPVTFRKDGNVPSDGSGMSFGYLRDRLAARSALYAGLAERGVVEKTSFYDLTLVADDPALNVFNIDTSVWSGQSRGIFITAPSNSTVLINVSGAFVGITNSSMHVYGTSHENVLINYFEAQTVATAGFTHTASVLAMQADGVFSGGSIDGRAVFGGSVVTTTGFEFHNYHFTGAICTGDEPEDTPPRITYAFTVENTGNVPLYNIEIGDPLVSVTGALAELASGANDTNTFSAVYYLSDEELASGADITNTAEVIGATALGHIVSDTNTCVVDLPDPEPEEPFVPPASPEDPPDWMKPDFVIRSVTIIPSPTVVGTRFRASVRVSNEGDLPGDPGNIELWSGNDTYTSAPATAPDASIPVGNIKTGESVVVTFDDLRAPFVKGTYHAMAVVNRAGAIQEKSTGNNHGGATYTLEPLTVNVEPCAEGMRLSWNSVPGYYYFMERSDSLGQPFRDIADNIPATPPLNVFTDTDVQGAAAFYRVWGYKP